MGPPALSGGRPTEMHPFFDRRKKLTDPRAIFYYSTVEVPESYRSLSALESYLLSSFLCIY